MQRSSNRRPAWADVRHQMNETLRRQAEARFGREFLEKVIAQNLEDSLAAWLEPFLSGRARPETLSRGGQGAAADGRDQVIGRLVSLAKPPVLVLGRDVGALAEVLEAEAALETDAWRIPLAREAFPAREFKADDFLDTGSDGQFRSIVAWRYLGALRRADSYARFRQVFPAVARRLRPGGRLLVVDSLAFQDDVVTELAALDFEIHDIAPLAERSEMLIDAAFSQ